MAIDLSDFINDVLSTDAFGEEVIWTPTSGGANTISGVFDNEYTVESGTQEIGIGLPSPRVTCKTADVPSAARGDHLAIAGVTYHVLEVQPDGMGFTVLILSRDEG